MKRTALFILIFSLVISLVAPAGVVFAETGDDGGASETELLLEGELGVDGVTKAEEIVSNGELVTMQSDGEEETPEPQLPIQPDFPLLIAKAKAGSASDEFVEMYNPNAQTHSLYGWKLWYYKNDAPQVLYTFSATDTIDAFGYFVIANFSHPENADQTPFASDRYFEVKNANGKDYTKNVITQNDAVWLERNGQVVDMVGWGSAKKFETKAFTGISSDTIQRCMDASGQMVDTNDNSRDFAIYTVMNLRQSVGCPSQTTIPEPSGEEEQPPAVVPPINYCKDVKLNEIGANLDTAHQFVEVKNISDKTIDLKGCSLKTNRSTTKSYHFGDIELDPQQLLVVNIAETDLTLTKTTEGTVYILDSAGNEVDEVSYKNLAKNTSWSLVDDEWWSTYAITPDGENVYQRYLPCDEGYTRNELTGRCNKIVEPAVLAECGEGRERNPLTGRCRTIPQPKKLAPCKEGQYRSEETNRCRSIASAAAAVLKPCRDDQFRNPATNRCKKIASTDDILKPCQEGYERNPETNRCRKVRVASATIADFPVETVKDGAKSFVAWWAFGGIVIGGLAIGVWEWRQEIAKTLRKIVSQGKK